MPAQRPPDNVAQLLGCGEWLPPPLFDNEACHAPGARPQSGVTEADIVIEEIVNDNRTRFAMIFQSGGSDPVGPIRSGRIQDIDLFTALNHPLFAWSGGNKTVTDRIDASELINIGPAMANLYFRTNDSASLAESIRMLNADRAMRRAYAEMAYSRARERFTTKRMIDEYLELYRSLVSVRSAAA